MKYLRRGLAVPFIVLGHLAHLVMESAWTIAEAILGNDPWEGP